MKLETVSTQTPGNTNDRLTFRAPRVEDGAAIWQLVKASGSLDENSMYCNMLQCTHFAGTCAIAELNGDIVGWMSGYIPPEETDVLFVWQICVGEAARGRGVAKKLIAEVLTRPVCEDVARIKSTITDDNDASWGLFGSVAKEFDAPLKRKAHFESDAHFDGAHDTEHLVTIGPFDRDSDVLSDAA